MKKIMGIISALLFVVTLALGTAGGAQAAETASPASAQTSNTQVASKVVTPFLNVVTPYINNPRCDSSPAAFYTVWTTTGAAFCFSNKGAMPVLIENVLTLCTGDNSGRVEYVNYSAPNTRIWSTQRGKNECHSFSGGVRVTQVQIF